MHVWFDALGGPDAYNDKYGGERTRECHKLIVDALCREYGLFQLPPGDGGSFRHYLKELADLADFFLQEKDVERVIDVIELSCRVIDRVLGHG